MTEPDPHYGFRMLKEQIAEFSRYIGATTLEATFIV